MNMLPDHSSAEAAATLTPEPRQRRRPRLGFLGVGWIGRHRMQAVIESDLAEIVAVADPSAESLGEAQQLVPQSVAATGLEGLLAPELDLDGLVIATPSAMHAAQATAALERGIAVFCQKPLARTAEETQRIVSAARAADRLLAVDFSYRFVSGVAEVRDHIRSGAIGNPFAIDLVFHNAYGPDKAWFYDPHLSGGGCVIDLGVHLVDLALWLLDFPQVSRVSSQLYRNGKPLSGTDQEVEDFAVAELGLANGAVVRLTCSWRLSAGRDAVIEATINGSDGAFALQNVEGSFYDFAVEHRQGTSRTPLSQPPDAWGGRAIVDWTRRLQQGQRFDAEAERLIEVASVLDRIYGR